MNWIKKGLIFNKSHAQLPLAFKLNPEEIRIYYSSRNERNESEIHYIDVDEHNPQTIIREGDNIFQSEPSWFDRKGSMTACIFKKDGEIYLYYTGWSVGTKYKYKHCIGLAKSKNGTVFKRIDAPVVESTDDDYFICSSPYVIVNETWKMWFISGRNCEGWIGNTPLYSIRYAESNNGYNWKQMDVCFPRRKNELFARPFIQYNGKYQMWYSWLLLDNGPKEYHMGYAESKDGITWERFDDKNVLTKSESGWDSQMVAFPYLIDNYMIYSGNYFGKEGMGYAIRLQD